VTKLLRTIRLDVSDTFAFEKAAEPGEWAIPGSFMFMDEDPASLTGKRRVAFRSGWLGVTSHGWSTIAVVVPASDEERTDVVKHLADYLMAEHGAPDMGTALAAADDEISFAESCADHPEQTLVVIHRTLDEEGHIREQFRTVKAGLPFNKDTMSRVFTFHEVEGEDEPEEHVDLIGMANNASVNRKST
jgi:Family of unknown function (DUF6505)